MDVQECLTEVKLSAGKDVYKGTFLPLLRVYRQNQDVEKLTRGLRELAAPLLPNHRLTLALATLLPSALQHSFQQQLKVVEGPPQANPQNATKLPSAHHVKRQKVAHHPSEGPAQASHHASNVAGNFVAPAPVTPKVEESCTPPMPDSKPAPAIHTNKQPEHCSQPLPTSAASEQSPARTQQNSSAAAGTAAQFRGNLKRIKDAETFQRQKERRQKKAAFLLDGTTTGPVVGFAKGTSWGQEPQQHPVRLQGGQLVQLPVRPNRSQVLLMQSITTALHQKRHALLESPTGTGKTLALLCASLAWQQQAHAAAHKPDVAVPRIFWAARTHAQIDHAVHEVRRTSYRPMMTILASRERFCLHPDIAVAPNKTEACEGATMVGHMDCSYLENAEASWYPQGPEHLPAYKPGGRLETFDIEELVAEGKAGHVCPYHASRDVLNEGAALVFVTYSQLLDPPVRSANGLDDLMKGAVLVFDEAHNIAAECRAAATLQMSTADLEALALDLGGMQGSLNKMAPASRQWRQAADWARELAQLVDTMQKWLARQLSSALPFQKEQGTGNSRAAVEVWEGSGQDAHDTVVHHLNLSVHRVETFQGRLKAMRRGLIEGGYESTAVKSGAINQLEGLLSKLLFVLQTGGLGYRCILSRQSTAGKARRGISIGQVSDTPVLQGTANGQAVPSKGSEPKGTAKGQAAPIEGSFSFLCLHAAVALTPLLPKAHSLLLTSGTLSPVAPLVAELGLGEKPKRQPISPHGSLSAKPFNTGKGYTSSQLPHLLPKQQQQQQQHKQQQQYGPAEDDGIHHKPGQKLSLPAGAGPTQQAHSTTEFSAQDLQAPSKGPKDAVQLGKALPQSDMEQPVGLQPSLLNQEQQHAQPHQLLPQQQQSQPVQQQQQHEQVHQQQQEVQQQQHQQVEQQQQHQRVKQQEQYLQAKQQQHQHQPARSQHARLHEGVELVSAPHHHTLPMRLLPLTISMAPGYDGQLVKLDSAYERRQDTAVKGSQGGVAAIWELGPLLLGLSRDSCVYAAYLDALGSAMLMLCQAVPNGVLCFFPSWGLLNAARDQWLVTGMYQHICACKEVVAEPSNVSGEVFDEAIKGYRQAAAKVSGALLMAVMRGRSSEGVDFLDDCARAVVVVGIPYPPLYETTVRLKRAFNRDHEALLGSGDDWYAAEAFRAVNQAIGRLIRHQKDYGAVILLDHRYNVLKFRQMTAAWLHPLLKSAAMADAPVLLHNFFYRTQSMK